MACISINHDDISDLPAFRGVAGGLVSLTQGNLIEASHSRSGTDDDDRGIAAVVERHTSFGVIITLVVPKK